MLVRESPIKNQRYPSLFQAKALCSGKFSLLLAGFLLNAAVTAYAQAADGKSLYASCAACHGQKGEGNRALGAPNIAGMPDWYVKTQLENFAGGRRGSKPGDTYGAQMRGAAMALSTPADRATVAAFVAKMPKTAAAAKPPAKANLANGATQYNALCGSCHAANGKGNKALGAPALGGIDPVYIARQYANFRTGLRGTHPSDKLGKQMAAISKMLDAKAEQDVLAYIGTLKP
jgi:cytochrome c553